MPSQKQLSETEIQKYCTDKTICVRVLETVDSTNEEAKRHYTDNTLIIAEEQTRGKGRREKQFYSPKYTGIYMSFLTANERLLSKHIPVTLTAAVAVAEAITSLCPIVPQIKWVNDILLNGKKIGGILTEALLSPDGTRQSVIIGIGINVSIEKFPEELSETAASLAQSGYFLDRNRLIAEIVNRLKHLTELTDEEILVRYKKYSCVLKQCVTVIQAEEIYEATALDILPDGTLLVETKQNEKRILSSGEVSVKIR